MTRKKDIRLQLAARLRLLRAQRGFTQQKLAELAEIDYKHVQLLESKDPSCAKLDTIEKLAKALGMTCSELLDFEE